MRRVAKVIWNEILPSSPVFSTSTVTEFTGSAPSNVSRDLGRLEAEGMITHIRRGLWAVPHHPDFSPYAAVPHLFEEDRGGYVSLLSALSLHGMIDQIPRVVQVMTTTQRSRLRTPVGAYEFHQMQPALFGGFGPYRRMGNFDIATPEKALFDAMYLSARKGRRFAHLPEMEPSPDFSPAEVEEWIARVGHEPLRLAILERWRDISSRTPGDAGPGTGG
jgi:predicted transcriptional regulator of viral defense system